LLYELPRGGLIANYCKGIYAPPLAGKDDQSGGCWLASHRDLLTGLTRFSGLKDLHRSRKSVHKRFTLIISRTLPAI
jgi:hypothetical protein